MPSTRRSFIAAAALSQAAWLTPTSARAESSVLRIVPHTNLAILDPIWTTAYVTRNHGYLIYDTLFGTDEHAVVKPQMVERWQESQDRRQWTFQLRRGLEFHDGKPVTGDDVIASLKRWGKRDSMGAALMQFVERMDSPRADTFRIFLNEPNGFMLEALGKPSSTVPFIMPRRIAETDAFKQIDEHIGSGPFIFKRDEFKPGDKAVYLKNAHYVPRGEPPSGTTGGKHVYTDRVEWNLALRDLQSQINALKNGEVDIVEYLPFDFYDEVKADATLQIPKVTTRGNQLLGIFNHLQKPFNNPKVRRAALAAMPQEPFLQAQVGVKALYKTCPSMFICGTPYGSTAGSEVQARGMRQAREMLKASGYDGTPIVMMKVTDSSTTQKLPDVAAQLLRQAGFRVELQAMDFQSMVVRRAKKGPATEGGWSMFFAAWTAFDASNPISNLPLDARGEKGWFGWASDDQLVALRNRFMRAGDEAEKKKLAEQIHVRAFEIATHAVLGEYQQPMAAARNVSGFFVTNGNLYWNLKKS